MLLGILLGALMFGGGYKFQSDHDACVTKKEGKVKIDSHKLCSTYVRIYDLKEKLK